MKKRLILYIHFLQCPALFSFDSLIISIKDEYTKAEAGDYTLAHIIESLEFVQKKLIIMQGSLQELSYKISFFSNIIIEMSLIFNDLSGKMDLITHKNRSISPLIKDQQGKISVVLTEISSMKTTLTQEPHTMPLEEIILKLKLMYNQLIEIKNELTRTKMYTEKIINFASHIPPITHDLSTLIDDILSQ